jgi:hypothetical protein
MVADRYEKQGNLESSRNQIPKPAAVVLRYLAKMGHAAVT